MNVASSLTFTYAFNLGLVDGGMEDMSEEDALEDAWSQEETVREDTLRWLEAQLSVSMAPLSDEDVEAYVDISGDRGGRDPQRRAVPGLRAGLHAASPGASARGWRGPWAAATSEA